MVELGARRELCCEEWMKADERARLRGIGDVMSTQHVVCGAVTCMACESSC